MKIIELITSPNETTYDRVIHNGNLETQYSPDDFVGTPDFKRAYKPEKAYAILNGGFVLAIVFGETCEQDALDAAEDANKLDGLQITQEELKEYETGEYSDVGNEHTPPRKIKTEVDGEEVEATLEHGGWPVYDERVTLLGNASEPFDQESLDIWEVPLSVFAEDPALMTLDRVVERLDDAKNDAQKAYAKVDAYHADWSKLYRAVGDLEDALTLCHFAAAR